MAPEDDRGIEDLLRGSEMLVKELREAGIPESEAVRLAGDIESWIQKVDLEDLDKLTDPVAAAVVEIDVSLDQMLARGTFRPPAGNGHPLDLDHVKAELARVQVTAGIRWDTIAEAVESCNTRRIRLDDVVVAQGIDPVEEAPQKLLLEQSLARKHGADALPGHVDTGELSSYPLVSAGEVLARRVPSRPGKQGVTVRGAPVPFRTADSPSLEPGGNTEVREDAVVATCSGRLRITADAFWVEEVLRITGDLAKNLDFPGDVTIEGRIPDGLVVKAGGSLHCFQSIGASRIECKGDLTTNQGILGRRQATLRIGGSARARFVEGCRLDAAGPIRVATSIMHSVLTSVDRVETGESGIIVASIIHAQNGVSAAQIGTEGGPRAEIHCGTDHAVERKLLLLRDRGIALVEKLKEIDARMNANTVSAALLKPLREKVEENIHTMSGTARSLAQSLHRNGEAKISVRGKVFPGTYIEICSVSYLVARPMEKVTFRLDKASGRIVPDPLEEGAP